MTQAVYRVVLDAERGYRRLDPVPDRSELNEFYHSEYYALLAQGRRGQQLARLSGGGALAEAERDWLRRTLYADLLALLEAHRAPGSSRELLDVGCGTGEFMRLMQEHGWSVHGIELAPAAVELARTAGLEVDPLELQDFAQQNPARRFDCIAMLHVLEHIPEPEALLRTVHALLRPGGMLLVQVPNDFSALQEAAAPLARRSDWWIAVPDHVNYFDHPSLARLLAAQGFDVLDATGNFPMEMFLLMGEDYVDDPEVGRACHQKRVRFELALPADVRRRLYRSLAQAGVGRDCIVLARKPS